MFFTALATDYDGTIATDGRTPEPVIEALRKFKASGRRLILVTGRELEDLQRVFPEHDLFDRIVAENGALLYEPARRRERVLAPPPPPSFVEALRAQKIAPLSIGRVIVASWEPNEGAVLDTIKAQGLELQIIFNKGAVMVLPPGINKASGLKAALEELQLSPINVAGIGDAENDHAFLSLCGCAAAVANALPMLKEKADLVLVRPRGEGAVDLMAQLQANDAALLPERFAISPGRDDAGEALIMPGAGNLLIAGHSAVGKSTLATALTEQMVDKGLQFCVLDPEGDFEALDNAIQVGGAKVPPSLTEIEGLLAQSATNLVINTLAIPIEDRPLFFADFLAAFSACRLRSGRPHWLIVDEAHHVLPAARDSMAQALSRDMSGVIFITVHPDAMSAPALQSVTQVLAAGEEAGEVLTAFCGAVDAGAVPENAACGARSMLLFERGSGAPLRCLEPVMPLQVHKRHLRKYAQGELGPDKSFYFQGPQKELNLRAANLASFLNIAEGVGEATWSYHRGRGDYSAWLKDAVKDDDLARHVAVIERDAGQDWTHARAAIRKQIEDRYTAPARAG